MFLIAKRESKNRSFRIIQTWINFGWILESVDISGKSGEDRLKTLTQYVSFSKS